MTDKYVGFPTSRSFPRSVEEAFKDDPSNAEWFYPPEEKRGIKNAVMMVVGIVLWAVLLYLLLGAS